MNPPIESYRDLVAWQRGMQLCRLIYVVTRQMPPDERFGLTNQMRRAAVSVPSNIAEGYGRQSRSEYVRFLKIARGSLLEVSTQYELAWSMKLIEQSSELASLIEETERILSGLIRSLNI